MTVVVSIGKGFICSIHAVHVHWMEHINVNHYVSIETEVTGGNVSMTMIWSPKPGMEFTLVKETMDECDLLTEVNYSCPIKQGEYVFHRLGKVPSVLPQVKTSYYALKHTNYQFFYTGMQGLYKTFIKCTIQNGKEGFCGRINLTLTL